MFLFAPSFVVSLLFIDLAIGYKTTLMGQIIVLMRELDGRGFFNITLKRKTLTPEDVWVKALRTKKLELIPSLDFFEIFTSFFKINYKLVKSFRNEN